jgi:MoxR-like ATPase
MTLVRSLHQGSQTATTQRLAAILAQLERIVVGKPEPLRLALACLLARGHLLIEDIPGIGKSTLAQALAAVLGLPYTRVQFTSDLLPADLLGVSIFDAQSQSFRFHQGPIFSSVVLSDEINRAPPKTQSALLEAMEERQASVDRSVFALPADFLVLATQNPREFEGTYPLPESQLDRFMLRIDVDYPERASEAEILARYGGRLSGTQQVIEGVATIERSLLDAGRAEAERMHVADALTAYVLDLVRASREHPRVSLGLSTRGALALMRAARVSAGLRGAEFVSPDDVKDIAPWVMPHRLVLTPEAALEGAKDVEVVRALLADTPVPR